MSVSLHPTRGVTGLRERPVTLLLVALATCVVPGCTLILDAPGPAAGGGTDAGTPDTGTPDTGMPPEVECPERLGVRFCDGFEQGFRAWIMEANRATLALTPDAAKGAQAMEATLSAAGGRAIVGQTFAGFDQEPMWARVFLKLKGDEMHTSLTVFRVEDSIGDGVDLSFAANRAQLYANVGETELAQTATDLFPVDQWVCVELSITPEGEGAAAALHVNGDQVVGGAIPWPSKPIELILAGLPHVDESQPIVTVGVDSVVISESRVGCD
jgi:hypothetical protein